MTTTCRSTRPARASTRTRRSSGSGTARRSSRSTRPRRRRRRPPRATTRARPRRRELLAEAGEVGGQYVERRELLVGVQLLGAIEERDLGLLVARIGQAALDGTHGLAGLVVMEADALGAQRRIDHVDVVALGDRLVRALRLAGAAVDALFGD